MKKLTVGIPAYKAKKTINECLASVLIQTAKDEVSVVIASDLPEEDYSYVKDIFPTLDIETLSCAENTGAGLARQRCLDACKTEWITFIDADDVFYSPFALEQLLHGIQPNAIQVQGLFLQEVDGKNPQGIRAMPQQNPNHPWVFGRIYNVEFLRKNDIAFDETRAMEDGQFNWKIRMTIEGSPLMINVIQEPIYLWRIGSEHSITRSKADKDDEIPQYNFDLCQLGATIAAIRATKFCKEKNPFNGGIDRFITETMVGQYFTYVECKSKKPIFAEQNFFNAKRFYHECFCEIEDKISDKILSDIYTAQRMIHGQDLIGIIPDISFVEFMEKVKTEEYGGEEELREIRSKYPKEVIESDIATGVSTF